MSRLTGRVLMRRYISIVSLAIGGLVVCCAADSSAAATPALVVSHASDANDPATFPLVDARQVAAVVVDPHDYEVVSLAAGLFADDVERVTGRRPAVAAQPTHGPTILVGTLGHSAWIDRLVQAGKLPGVDAIKGRWEATRWQIVDAPFPGVARALVIVGSDRRGAAYGLMALSERIGVSPWFWWADVPVHHADVLSVHLAGAQLDQPSVKYRGIFINDEDWGLFPWAAHTFDPAFGNIGPKTYAKVFELLLRLRLNYLWPAMHACSAEFASQPENIALADRYAIVAGASHCEPMLCNNVHWNEATQGKWDYRLNREAIHNYWEQSTRARGRSEAVWTLGIRGIHDAGMEGPRDTATRLQVLSQVIRDERDLLAKHVSPEWGPVAQCFVPYKEVLPIYDAGLPVPDDVTLVWVDDNFGYIRRLGRPSERQRAGGAGVYWHLSYYGAPHSYTWINTTAPGLMWEELRKAWDNDARTLWIINVGDIKPMEIGIDYFARFAWSPATTAPDSQPTFLREFAARNFGAEVAPATADLLDQFYKLGTFRKPELMTRRWALGLSDDEARRLEQGYAQVMTAAATLATAVPTAAQDAFAETIGIPAEILGATGRIFLADRQVQHGVDPGENTRRIDRLRRELETAVTRYNTQLAGGKWNRMLPGLVTGKDIMAWSSEVRWPWGASAAATAESDRHAPPASAEWRDAAAFTRSRPAATGAAWRPVAGLGRSARALTVLPASLRSSWEPGDPAAPAIEYDVTTPSVANAEVLLDFMPTFRVYPGRLLRVAVTVDGGRPVIVEVPGSSGQEDERGASRQIAVQDNSVTARVAFPALAAGHHTVAIQPLDPGVVLDRVALP